MDKMQQGRRRRVGWLVVATAGVLAGHSVVLAQTSEGKSQPQSKAQDKMDQKADDKKGAPIPAKPKPDQTQPLALTVTTDKKTYAAGTAVKMTLTVKNTTTKPMKLTFGSGQKYDFTLREGVKPDGKIVWQWARGRMFPQMVSSETLEPGKTLVFSENYDPKSSPAGSEPLKVGTYTLTATLAIFGTRPTASAQVLVK